MILALIIMVIVAILLAFVIAMVAAIGAGGIIMFADVIVCILFLVWVLKKILKKK